MRISPQEAKQIEKLRGHGFLTEWQHGYYDENGKYHDLPNTPANELIEIRPQGKRLRGLKRFVREVKFALYLDK